MFWLLFEAFPWLLWILLYFLSPSLSSEPWILITYYFILIIFSDSIKILALITQWDWASLVAQMVKESSCNAGDWDSIPGLGRCPREGNGNPLKYSWLENSMDRGAWQATVQGLSKSQTWLNTTHHKTVMKVCDCSYKKKKKNSYRI